MFLIFSLPIASMISVIFTSCSYFVPAAVLCSTFLTGSVAPATDTLSLGASASFSKGIYPVYAALRAYTS